MPHANMVPRQLKLLFGEGGKAAKDNINLNHTRSLPAIIAFEVFEVSSLCPLEDAAPG